MRTVKNLSNTLNILIDSDVHIFTSSLAGKVETDWGSYTDDDGIFHETNIVTTYDLGKATSILGYQVNNVVAKVLGYMEWTGNYKVTMCLSHKKNFRKTLMPSYKANRTAPKPVLYNAVREYVEKNYECECWENCEADDVLSMLGTSMENSVVCSVDKDMLTIRDTTFYNWKRGTFEVTDPQTAQWHHYYQCLRGDSVDGYSGAKGIGDVKARKVLDTECSWSNVVATYESKGQTEKDALLMARMAKLLTPELYDRHSGEVRLWTPEESLCLPCQPDETKEVTV